MRERPAADPGALKVVADDQHSMHPAGAVPRSRATRQRPDWLFESELLAFAPAAGWAMHLQEVGSGADDGALELDEVRVQFVPVAGWATVRVKLLGGISVEVEPVFVLDGQLWQLSTYRHMHDDRWVSVHIVRDETRAVA